MSSMSLKSLRGLIRGTCNAHLASIPSRNERVFRLITCQRSVHTNLTRLSASRPDQNSLKDSFNARKTNKEEVQPDDDDDDIDFEHVRNIDQLKQKVLEKYQKDEKKYNAQLVYVGGLTSQLKMAKILSLSSSAMGIGLLPFLTQTLSASTFFAQAFVYGTTGFFIFATPLLSQYLTRRYVSRMYYNYEEKKFKAVLFNFFLREYVMEFDLKDVYMPDIPGAFSTLKLKSNKRSLFVDLNQIDDVRLVEKILGYDQPFDIKKYTDQSSDKEN